MTKPGGIHFCQRPYFSEDPDIYTARQIPLPETIFYSAPVILSTILHEVGHCVLQHKGDNNSERTRFAMEVEAWQWAWKNAKDKKAVEIEGVKCLKTYLNTFTDEQYVELIRGKEFEYATS